MNKTLIFFQIREMVKSTKTEAVFTKTEMNNKWNGNFLLNKRNGQKVSRLKPYLLRWKWAVNEILIFFQ